MGTFAPLGKQATWMIIIFHFWMLFRRFIIKKRTNFFPCKSFFSLLLHRYLLISLVPRTEPMGETVRYVKEGSRVTLHCVISGAIDPPLYVIWYHGTQQIFPDNPRHWKTEVTHQDVDSNKLVKSNDDNEAVLASSQQSMFDSRKTVSRHFFNSIFISIWFGCGISVTKRMEEEFFSSWFFSR